MSGEEFLNKLYKDLNLSAEVQHTARGTKNKNEAVARYMERLSKTHGQAIKNEHRIKLLKQMYYDKYVVKEDDIPKYRDKERIIQGQKESLDRWLNYLLDESAVYPMWAKYWVFQGMLKIGTYDEANGVYQKRSKKTLAPFVDANPEIIARCINLATDYIGKKELNDNELEQLVESGNFSKLYTVFLKKQKENTVAISESNDGIWITYHHETEEQANEKERKGIEPEYLKLYNSLQGYNTGWCTAGGKDTAKDQICGISRYIGGDFHVYYTKDNNNEYKVPRIAIRMNETDIGEIRGVAEGQNIEDGLEEIVKEKISTFKGIEGDDIAKSLEIINNMKYLTLLNKKNANNQEFTEDDIKFIYELNKTIEGFGWQKDPRIEKIICKRNKTKDCSVLKEKKDIINFWQIYYKELPDDLKRDREFMLELIKQNGFILEYASEELKNDREIVMEAVKQEGANLEYASEELKNDREIVLEAVKQEPHVLKYAHEELKNDKEIVLTAVKQNSDILWCASKELQKDREIVLEAVKINCYTLKDVTEKLKKDKEIVLAAVQQNGFALEYASEKLKNDREIVMEAVKQNSYALRYASEKLKKFFKKTNLQEKKIEINFINDKIQKIKNKLKLYSNNFKSINHNKNRRSK